MDGETFTATITDIGSYGCSICGFEHELAEMVIAHKCAGIHANELAEIISRLKKFADSNPITTSALFPITNDLSRLYRKLNKASGGQ